MILAVREMEPSRRWRLSSSCRVHHGRRGSSFSCPVSKIRVCFFRTKKPRRNCVSCPYRVALVQRKYRRAHYLGRLYRVRPTGDHRHSRSNSLPLSFSLQSEPLEHQSQRTANRKREKGRGKPIGGSRKHHLGRGNPGSRKLNSLKPQDIVYEYNSLSTSAWGTKFHQYPLDLANGSGGYSAVDHQSRFQYIDPI